MWFILLVSCFSSKKISNKNLSFLYEHGFDETSPQYKIYHYHKDSSKLFIRIFRENLEFDYNDNSELAARVRFEGFLYSDVESGQYVDSFSLRKYLVKNENKGYYDLSVAFKCRTPEKHILEIIYTDFLKHKVIKNYLHIDRSSDHTRQNFLLKDGNTGAPFFTPYLTKNDRIIIEYNNKDSTRLFFKYYRNEFRPAIPVFMDLKLKSLQFNPVDIYTSPTDSSISFNKEGIYHIQTDTSQAHGLTLYCFHEDYPRITRPDHLAQTLRYITKNKEYNIINKAGDQKAEIDNFWLSRAGSRERAKILIKEYYLRIQDANKFFISYKEGWKTDRGIVYVIYGAPHTIYKGLDHEEWIYEPLLNEPSLSFKFLYNQNRFTNNNYLLHRSYIYEDSWNIEVHRWRHGRLTELKD